MMDFGIARFSRAQSQTVSDKAIGSVHYISPEQAKGDKTDARTDIYSVGVMLYEMLSGKLPFDGDGAVSIAIMQISDKAKPLAQVAPTCPEALLPDHRKSHGKGPGNRYQSAQEMLEAIEAFKRNPSARFAYEYRNTEDNPERNINRVVNSQNPPQNRRQKSAQRSPARSARSQPGAGANSAKRKKEKFRQGAFLCCLFLWHGRGFRYRCHPHLSDLHQLQQPAFSNRTDVHRHQLYRHDRRTSSSPLSITPCWRQISGGILQRAGRHHRPSEPQGRAYCQGKQRIGLDGEPWHPVCYDP